MSKPPIYVVADTYRIAENFIHSDLQEDPKRLRYIDEPDRLRGLRHILLYIHPTGTERRNYGAILEMAKQQGCILARIDDSWSRARYAERGNFL